MAVTPRIDIAFKKLGVEENKDLLISLINSIVSEGDQVSDVDLLNRYTPQNFEKDSKVHGINDESDKDSKEEGE